jgi:hypothetical protein
VIAASENRLDDGFRYSALDEKISLGIQEELEGVGILNDPFKSDAVPLSGLRHPPGDVIVLAASKERSPTSRPGASPGKQTVSPPG